MLGKNLELGDVVCLIQDGVVWQKESIVKIAKNKAITDKDNELDVCPTCFKYKCSNGYNYELFTDEMKSKIEKLEAKRKKISDLDSFLITLKPHYMQDKELNILHEAMEKILKIRNKQSK